MITARNLNSTSTVTALLVCDRQQSIDYSSLLREAQSIARAEIRYALAARKLRQKPNAPEWLDQCGPYD